MSLMTHSRSRTARPLTTWSPSRFVLPEVGCSIDRLDAQRANETTGHGKAQNPITST